MKKELIASKVFFDKKLEEHNYEVLDSEFFDGSEQYLKYSLNHGVELFMYGDGECQCHKGLERGYCERYDFESLEELRNECWKKLLAFLSDS